MKPVSGKNAELALLERFINAYNRQFGVELTMVQHRDKPDFVVSNPETNEHIGIEVTGVYQNPEEAKIQYGVIQNWDRFEGCIDDLLTSLNSRLADKAKKAIGYRFDGRILLAIWFGSLVFMEKFDIDFIRHEIVIPENRFDEIWLILQNRIDNSPELYLLQEGNA